MGAEHREVRRELRVVRDPRALAGVDRLVAVVADVVEVPEAHDQRHGRDAEQDCRGQPAPDDDALELGRRTGTVTRFGASCSSRGIANAAAAPAAALAHDDDHHERGRVQDARTGHRQRRARDRERESTSSDATGDPVARAYGARQRPAGCLPPPASSRLQLRALYRERQADRQRRRCRMLIARIDRHELGHALPPVHRGGAQERCRRSPRARCGRRSARRCAGRRRRACRGTRAISG